MNKIFFLILISFSLYSDNSYIKLENNSKSSTNSFFYRAIDKNNYQSLEENLKNIEDINSVNSYYEYNLLNYSLLNSKYDFVPLIKENKGEVSKKTFGNYKGQYIRYLNNINIKELLYFGYPRLYNYENYKEKSIDGLPIIYIQIAFYMLQNPFDSLENLYDSSSFIMRILGKTNFYNALENYILALINTDYLWPVQVGYKEFNIDFNFVDNDIDRKGYTRIGGTNSIYGENSTTLEQKKEDYLWTLSKFFHRRGEVFGQLCHYYILRFLEDMATKDKEAKTLYDKYAFELKERYNLFAENWNKGILPVYPYDEFEGDKNKWEYLVSLPMHLDAVYLKSIRPTLPILSKPLSGKRVWNVDFHNINYFQSGENKILKKLHNLNKTSSLEEIKNIYDIINKSSYKYNPQLWMAFYLTLKNLNLSNVYNQIILNNIISLNYSSYERTLDNDFKILEELLKKGYLYDAVKFYNSLKIRKILKYENEYEDKFKKAIGGGLSYDPHKYLSEKKYDELDENSTFKKFLFRKDYEELHYFDGEIIILLDDEEVKNIEKVARSIINKNGTTAELIQNVSPQTFLATWPKDKKNMKIYENLLFDYILFLEKNSDKLELTIRFSEELLKHGIHKKEIYKVLIHTLEKSYKRNSQSIYKEKQEKYIKLYKEKFNK